MKDKLRVLLVKRKREIDLLEAEIKEDKVMISKDMEPQYSNECVFNMKEVSNSFFGRVFSNRFRKRQPCVIYEEGKIFCASPGPESLLEPITDKDRKNVVLKEIVKTLGRYQTMKPWMFIGLLIPIIIVIILQIVLMRGGRPF
ncbi:MAG: hypothetical protein MUO31_04810 [Thermodesulfovibrionales bacterium]|nr:hypothetical protein [Thermodesulfovibrionales bacterium]